jgi:NADPH:quinone reductase
VYDAVGGATTPSALAGLARRGRLVVISAIGSPVVEINIRDLYRNESRILGVDSGKLSIVDSARRLEAMAPYFESGAFRPLPIAASYSLDDAPAAYQAVADQPGGRIVIRPKDLHGDRQWPDVPDLVAVLGDRAVRRELAAAGGVQDRHP